MHSATHTHKRPPSAIWRVGRRAQAIKRFKRNCSGFNTAMTLLQQADAPPAAAAEADAVAADPVARTCRGACALRALELMKRPQDPIIRDELALEMAGARALQDFGARWDGWCAAEGPGKHSYFAARAAVLDRMVEEAAAELAAAGGGGGGGSAAERGGRSAVGGGGASTRVQVLSLGAGMDTRPWRLALPEGTLWFDVDQANVLALKAKLLAEAGAALGGAAAGAAGGGGGGGLKGGGGVKFPLKCSSYRQIAADFECDSWQQLLAAAGASAATPTVVVAEGLCYYLSAAANASLLETAAAVVPRGSRLIATHIPAENLAANQACDGAMPLARLFTVCIDDVMGSGMVQRAGWGDVAVTGDIAEVTAARFSGRQLYYPYSLAYSGGAPLGSIECILTATRL